MKKEELFRAVGKIDDTLIEEFETRSPSGRKHWARYGALAACICLLAVGVMLLLPKDGASLPVTQSPTETRIPQTSFEQTQTVPAPSEDQPQLTYAEGSGALAADIALPDGYFFRDLTDEGLASVWGMETLSWEGYDPAALDLQAELIYDGTGRVWCLELRGTLGESEFILTLSPERLPPSCIVYEGGTTCDIYGTGVTALRFGGHVEITFLRGAGETAVGARLEANGVTEEMETLLTRIVSQSLREDGVLQLDQLKTEDIPAWRSESLSEQQARAEVGFGEYLPETLPVGFAFEAAYRELGEDRNWLSATWYNGYDNLSVTVDKCADLRGLVHADEIEKYDRDYYGTEKPDVPDEYWESRSSPTFYAEELTKEVIERRLCESDMGNFYTSFSVLYPDGTVVSVKVSAEESTLWQLLSFLLPN